MRAEACDKAFLYHRLAAPAPRPGDPVGPEHRPLFVEHVLRGCKPVDAWAVGAELELICYERDSLERIGPPAVEALLAGFEQFGARVTVEDGHQIAATADWGSVTIEPGGQIEFSGNQYTRLGDLEAELQTFLDRLGELARLNRVAVIAAGFDPLRSIAEQRWFPKRRYRILRPYLATRGRRGWDMMCRTGAIQGNLDYGSPSDLEKKFVAANRLGPVIAAMFANSPFEDGRLSGLKSTRVAVWLDTDPDRAGVSPAVFGRFSADGFVDYALGVPMLFARRGSDYVDLAGIPFREFLDGGALGVTPVFQDFTDHLTTIFTEARLKQHIELRSADAGGIEATLAAMALGKGLFYEAGALDEAVELAPDLDPAGFARLQLAIARDGLAAHAEGVPVLDIAKALVRTAAEGLRRIAPDEVRYLDPLAERVEEGWCPADRLIRDFEGRWGRDASRAVEALSVVAE